MSDVIDAVSSPERLAALGQADLVDTPPEEGFDHLTRLAARLLNAPIALVSLVDKDRQFFKSCIGPLPEPWLSQRQTPLSHSFCQYAVASKEALVVEDAREHPVLKGNLAIQDLGVIAYAGIPLITPDGQALGSLCVIDSKPREWTEEQIETLRALAGSVMATISYRAEACANQPATSKKKGAPSQGEARTASVSHTADMLAGAVSDHLHSLDGFDACIRSENSGSQIECQNTVLDTERKLKEAVQEFQKRLIALGEKTSSPDLQDVIELWRACTVYFDAMKRQGEVMERFTGLQASMDEIEREAAAVISAEQAVRMALRTYELKRE
jgi:signal transduction protein with GAF and PtsI domain